MFGANGSSVVSLGVRFAQFSANSNINLKSDPDWHFYHKYRIVLAKPTIQTLPAPLLREVSAALVRRFRGMRPHH